MTDSLVSVTTFGPGYGESIIIYIPHIGWGVIDSCLAKVDDTSINPALEYLLQKKVEKLAFVVLTHPHADHFLGIDQLVKHYSGRISNIFIYSGEGLREYKIYLSKKMVLQGGSELNKLAAVFKSLELARDAGAKIVKISEQTAVIRKEKYGNYDMEILALSPSAESLKRYVELLYKAIPVKDGDVLGIVPDDHHNLLSAALWCSVGNLRLIFGSDLEAGADDYTGWNNIVSSPTCPNLATHLIKVSHHGSVGAFYKPAWEKFEKPVSVITPFNRSKPLPQESMVKQIEKYSKDVAITSKPSYLNPQKAYGKAIANQLRGVREWSVIVDNPRAAVGYVNLDFSPDDGKLINQTAVPPAYFLKK
jgi:hypothetical protein